MDPESPELKPRDQKPRIVLTVGHSTHALNDFITLLQEHGIERVIDIRTIPRSRHNPQFNRETLVTALRGARISYVHLKKLGGLRHPRPDSSNQGWRNASFRGFADYMQTPEFESGLARALKLAVQKRSALLCAEAVPWRCHRSLVADALVVRRVPVEHILSPTRRQPHRLTSFAHVRGQRITYPAGDGVRRSPRAQKRSRVIEVARVYNRNLPRKGLRFLVERLWPRGMKKSSLKLDGWLKDVAPSNALRQWFGHRPERWAEFQRRYLAELREKPETWNPIFNAARRGGVTLLYSAHDTKHNNAIVLQQFLSHKTNS